MLKRFFKKDLKTLPSIGAYALWAQQYPAEAHNVLMQIEQQAMLDLMPNLQDQVVLDLACGTGRYGKIALEKGAKKVIGLDNSFDMLRLAHIQHIAEATCNALPLASNSIDIVLCGLALGHLPHLDKAISEIGRILKSDGIALISDFHPFQYLNGARRTFTAPNGITYAVEHYAHLTSTYQKAFAQAHLQISAISEPSYNEKPVVIVYQVQKLT